MACPDDGDLWNGQGVWEGMKISIPRFSGRREQLFIVAYSIYMICSMLTNTFYYAYFVGVFKFVIAGCILMLLFLERLDPHLSRRAFSGLVVLYSIVMLIMLRATGETQRSFACVFSFVFAARSIDFRKIAKVTIFMALALIAFTVASALLGVIPNYFEQASGRNRYYLGYLYSLYGPAYMLNVTLLVLYVHEEDMRVWEMALLLLIGYYIFTQTNGRLSFYLSVIAVGIGLVNRITKGIVQRLHVIPLLLIPSYIVSFFVSLIISMFYSPNIPWLKDLNYKLGGRFHLGKASLAKYGVSLFGNSNIQWIGHGLGVTGVASSGEYNYVDSLYLQFLQRYGIVFMVVILVLLTAMMVVCYKKREYMLEIILALIAYHGIIDNLMMYLHFNTFWLLVGPLVFGFFRQRGRQERGRRKLKKNHVALSRTVG